MANSYKILVGRDHTDVDNNGRW